MNRTVYCCLAVSIICAAQSGAATQPYWDARIDPDRPEVRLTSGLTICDEELRGGRWVNRYWMSTGQIKRDYPRDPYNLQRLPGPVDSFELGIEGQDLGGTNTGAKPTAITKASPWSGILWNTSNYQERLPRGSEAAFLAGVVEDHGFGYEGSWNMQPLINASKIVTGMRGRSGWGHPSFFAKNNATGEWFAVLLGWSVNWSLELAAKQDATKKEAALSFRLGPAAADPALRVMEPGETVKHSRAFRWNDDFRDADF